MNTSVALLPVPSNAIISRIGGGVVVDIVRDTVGVVVDVDSGAG